jgi:hypothetical protein
MCLPVLPTGMSSVFVYYSTAVYYTHEVKERPSLHTDSTSYMMFYVLSFYIVHPCIRDLEARRHLLLHTAGTLVGLYII